MTTLNVSNLPIPILAYKNLEQKVSQSCGQTADLRHEETVNGTRLRYWTERIDTLDGAPFPDTVSVEAYVNGRWTEVFQYDGRKLETGIVKDEAALDVIRR